MDTIEAQAKKITEKIAGGTLYGETIDTNDIKTMIVAAYFLGRTEALKDSIEKITIGFPDPVLDARLDAVTK